mgnify:CR=1 FL=1
MRFPFVVRFETSMARIAPFMSNTVAKMRGVFGESWEARFEETLSKMFADEKTMENAIKGYVRFALEATKLQKRFEKDREYIPKTYADVAQDVYHNEDYMRNLYLPGILLSHYLWPHHYRQLMYFHEVFVPRMLASDDRSFVDVGVGTGFYSRQLLCASNDVKGKAYDISQHAGNYSAMQMKAFNLLDRWQCELRNVLSAEIRQDWPFLLSVEVLEHLEDPVTFLKRLRAMLRKGGSGFITAAITAPNADHIYLYNEPRDIIAQLEEAGFELIDFLEEKGYESIAEEPVPRIAAFIVA